VTSEITDGNGLRVAAHAVTVRQTERSVAVSAQDRHLVGSGIGDSQVENVGVMEMTCGDVIRLVPHLNRFGQLKRAVAVAQEDRDVVGSKVGNRQVLDADPPEVAGRDRSRTCASRVIDGVREREFRGWQYPALQGLQSWREAQSGRQLGTPPPRASG